MPNAKPGQVTVAVAVAIAVTVALAVTIDVEVQLKVELELGPRLLARSVGCLKRPEREGVRERLENSNCRCLWHKIARDDKSHCSCPHFKFCQIMLANCLHTAVTQCAHCNKCVHT